MRFSTITSLSGLFAVSAAQISAVQVLKTICPNAAPCTTSECRTPEQAAPFIATSMQTYGLWHVNELAAIVATMAYESGCFEYKHNVVPGTPGQGTANMQMPSYNLKYAQSLDGVKDKVAQYTTTDGLSATQLNDILAEVTPDQYNFASGAWLYSTQCSSAVKSALQADADSGFQQYISSCLGTTVNDGRTSIFALAKQAFNVK